MTAKAVVTVPTMGLVMDAASALPQPSVNPRIEFDRANLIAHNSPGWSYNRASAMLANVAYIQDESDPSYLRDQQ